MLPWVIKCGNLISNLAAEIIAYVYDLRPSGVDVETCWQVARQLAAYLQYLGIQDASRKTKPPGTQTNLAWAGTIFPTSENNVTPAVSQDKWDKAKRMLKELLSLYNERTSKPHSKN